MHFCRRLSRVRGDQKGVGTDRRRVDDRVPAAGATGSQVGQGERHADRQHQGRAKADVADYERIDLQSVARQHLVRQPKSRQVFYLAWVDLSCCLMFLCALNERVVVEPQRCVCTTHLWRRAVDRHAGLLPRQPAELDVDGAVEDRGVYARRHRQRLGAQQ